MFAASLLPSFYRHRESYIRHRYVDNLTKRTIRRGAGLPRWVVLSWVWLFQSAALQGKMELRKKRDLKSSAVYYRLHSGVEELPDVWCSIKSCCWRRKNNRTMSLMNNTRMWSGTLWPDTSIYNITSSLPCFGGGAEWFYFSCSGI